MWNIYLPFSLQSLIRTAEQLKIKGLCEINDHTNPESDTEVIYPPHKKIRASRHFERNNNKSNREESVKSLENHVQKLARDDEKRIKLKSPAKDSSKNNFSSPTLSSGSGKNMASLEMGMVSGKNFFKFHKYLMALINSYTEWKRGDGCSSDLYGFCTRATYCNACNNDWT